MRVAAGSDHAGFDLRRLLRAELAVSGHDVTDRAGHRSFEGIP
jgi:ribose 5-phosphate isomerase RpiB